MSVISLKDDNTFKLLVEKLRNADETTAGVLNKAVAQVAAEGRKKESLYEASKLEFRHSTTKWYKGQEFNGGSKWDSKLGGYRSKTRPALRLINFSWQNVANANKSFSRKIAKASVSSQTMNLWANPTKAYSSASPSLSADRAYRGFRWYKGAHRPAKLSFSSFESNIQSVIPSALNKVNTRWQSELNKVAR